VVAATSRVAICLRQRKIAQKKIVCSVNANRNPSDSEEVREAPPIAALLPPMCLALGGL
jgi:hypothetical protein